MTLADTDHRRTLRQVYAVCDRALPDGWDATAPCLACHRPIRTTAPYLILQLPAPEAGGVFPHRLHARCVKTFPALFMDTPCRQCGCCTYYAPAAFTGPGDATDWPRCVRCGERNTWLLLQDVL